MMKTRLMKLFALLFALLMMASLVSCLPEFGSSKEKETDEEEETKVQTSEMEGLEARLDTLEKDYALEYQRMAYEERHAMLEILEQLYGINFSGEIVKGYTVKQNSSKAVYICEFGKASDAKKLSTTTPSQNEINSALAAMLCEHMERKNNVILMGDSDLINQILSSKSSNKRPAASALPTPTYEPATTTPPYTKEPMSVMDEIINALSRNDLDYDHLNASEISSFRSALQSWGVTIYGEFSQVVRCDRNVNGQEEEVYIIEFYNEQDAVNTISSMLKAFEYQNDMRQERHSNVIKLGDWDLVVDIDNYYGN